MEISYESSVKFIRSVYFVNMMTGTFSDASTHAACRANGGCARHHGVAASQSERGVSEWAGQE